jgi:hypothetical protein
MGYGVRSRNAPQERTGWRGYFTGKAVHIKNVDRAPAIVRWWMHRQQRLSAKGRPASGLGCGSLRAGIAFGP